MNAERFHRVSEWLAAGGNRRGAVGLLLGGVLAALDPGGAGARRKNKKQRRRKRRCRAGRARCGGRCLDLQSHHSNCGACGRACPPNTLCLNGGCAARCNGLFICPSPQACGCFTRLEGGRRTKPACGVQVFGCDGATRCNDDAHCPLGRFCASGCPTATTNGVCVDPCVEQFP